MQRISIECRNVNDLYSRLLGVAARYGEKQDSRNGAVMALPGMLSVLVTQPHERVLFDEERNANPTFHLLEALWMLGGKDDVAFVAKYNSNMKTFSDDGVRFNAAYGHRWRNHFGVDQLLVVIDKLRANPLDRQVVLSMWDPTDDLTNLSTLDRPCNLLIVFRIEHGKLNMMTTNRSNDIVFGLAGANAVHLTVLQEFVARAVGVGVGCWNHCSANAHIYERHWDLMKNVKPYSAWLPYVGSQPLLTKEESYLDFLADCEDMCAGQADDFRTDFFFGTVSPMITAWDKWRRDEDKAGALYDLSCIEANDWRIASTRWLKRKSK